MEQSQFYLTSVTSSDIKIEYSLKNKAIYFKFLKSDGIIHRNNNLPAIIYIRYGFKNQRDNIIMLEYIVDNNYHRDGDLPARIILQDDGNFKLKQDLTGLTYKGYDFDLQDLSLLNKHGILLQWFKNNVEHRDNNKPSFKTKTCMKYNVNGSLYRNNNKPTIVYYNYDTKLQKYVLRKKE